MAILSCLILAIILWPILFNYWVLYIRSFTSRKTPSVAPLLGGLVGAVAVGSGALFLPTSMWWIPLLVDPGCVPYLASFLWDMVFKKGAFEETS